MTDLEQAARVRALLRLADRFRSPGHRHPVDRSMEQLSEIHEGLRKLHRELRPAPAPRYERRTAAADLFPPRGRGQGVVAEHRRRA